MGKWRGTAPLSQRGDWTHGPVLQLRYNDNNRWRKKATLDERDINKVKRAYEIAIIMLNTAIEITTDIVFGREYKLEKTTFSPTNKEVLEEYFGGNPDTAQLLTTLACTLQGLRDNSEENRLHLFSRDYINQTKDAGYVSSADPTYVRKKHRPKVLSHDSIAPRAGEKTLRSRGHIHINLKVNSAVDMAMNIVHEATHRFAGTGDFAYSNNTAKFEALSPAEQLNNADSYAIYCKRVYMSRIGDE